MALVKVLAEVAGMVAHAPLQVGAPVAAGEPVLILECMKMEIPAEAPCAGVLAALHVEPGATVEEGQLLATISA